MVLIKTIFAKMAFVKSKDGLRRHFSSPKWASSSLRMIFVEIIFTESKDGLRPHFSSPKWASLSFKMGFVERPQCFG